MGRRPKGEEKYRRLTILLPPAIHQKLEHDLEFRRTWDKSGAWTLSRLGRVLVAQAYGLNEQGNPERS